MSFFSWFQYGIEVTGSDPTFQKPASWITQNCLFTWFQRGFQGAGSALTFQQCASWITRDRLFYLISVWFWRREIKLYNLNIASWEIRDRRFYLISVWFWSRGISFDISKICVVNDKKSPFLRNFSVVSKASTFSKPASWLTRNDFFYLISVSFWKCEINFHIIKICVVGKKRSPFLLNSSVAWRRGISFDI